MFRQTIVKEDKPMKTSRMVSIALIVVMWAGVSAASVVVEGVRFPSDIEVKNTPMALQGYGLLRYMVFIKAYVGAFYLQEAVGEQDVLGPVAKRLELEYFHAIKGEDFAEATRRKIADNIGAEKAARLQPRIDRLAALYRDVKPGDRYALTYVPGEGTELALNGEPLGVIPGDDFQSAVFAIWLGPSPIDRDFRQSLMGAA